MKERAERFARLFEGYSGAHGIYSVRFKDDRGKYKGRATTVKGPATVEKFVKHLEGEQGIGVVPLRDDDTLLWAAIDIDDYKVGIEEIANRVKEQQLPFVCCESKSEGIHLYIFFDKPHEAQTVRNVLADYASRLGCGGSEVFPKQSYRASPEDIGNWINMPYFGSDSRRCFQDGRWLEVDEFLEHADQTRCELDVEANMAALTNSDLEGAPPCLCYHANNGGVPQGQKHDMLFALVVYCRKRWPDDWENKVMEHNQLIFEPALAFDEVTKKMKNMGRKEYDFQCSGPYCNKQRCRQATYGRGETAGAGPVEIGNVKKLMGDPVKWVVEIESTRVICSTEQLYSQSQFNRLCMETVTRCPGTLPQPRWLKYVDDLIKDAEIEHAPEDAGPKGQFMEALHSWLTNSNRLARELDEVLLSKPYIEDDVAYFKSDALFAYLEEKRFRYPTYHDVWNWLREKAKAKKLTKKVGGKTTNLWTIEMKRFSAEESPS